MHVDITVPFLNCGAIPAVQCRDLSTRTVFPSDSSSEKTSSASLLWKLAVNSADCLLPVTLQPPSTEQFCSHVKDLKLQVLPVVELRRAVWYHLVLGGTLELPWGDGRSHGDSWCSHCLAALRITGELAGMETCPHFHSSPELIAVTSSSSCHCNSGLEAGLKWVAEQLVCPGVAQLSSA